MMDWLNTNFYRDWAYNLAYPQLFPNQKRRSDEAQAATIEIGQQNAKRWLKILNDHWIGPKNQYLCGDQITIADYFGAALVTLGEVIRCRLLGLSERPALAQQHEEAAELGQGQRGVPRPRRVGERAAASTPSEDRGRTTTSGCEKRRMKTIPISVRRRPFSRRPDNTMRMSRDHILTTQVGSLPRPEDLIEANQGREADRTVASDQHFNDLLQRGRQRRRASPEGASASTSPATANSAKRWATR